MPATSPPEQGLREQDFRPQQEEGSLLAGRISGRVPSQFARPLEAVALLLAMALLYFGTEWIDEKLVVTLGLAIFVSRLPFVEGSERRHIVLAIGFLGMIAMASPALAVLLLLLWPLACRIATRPDQRPLFGALVLVAIFPFLFYLPGLSPQWVSGKVFEQGVLLACLSVYYLWITARREGLPRWSRSRLLLYVLPWQSFFYNTCYGPKEWLRQDRPGLQTALWGFQAALLFFLKAKAFFWLHTQFPWVLQDHALARVLLKDVGPAMIWGAGAVLYVEWYLLLSMLGDAVNTVARFSGFAMRSNFRFPLLACSPIDLWRRWAIWNRLFLLRAIYFPLGGNNKRVYLHILAVFLGSTIIFHFGLIGRNEFSLDAEYVFAWFFYLMSQGLLVCLEVGWWRWRGKLRPKDPPPWHHPSRIIGVIIMQTIAIWLHMAILLPWGGGLDERFEIMARMLGVD